MYVTILSGCAFLCIVFAYIIKHISTKTFGNVLIFWSITLVMFANFSNTTWFTQGHSILEKVMFTLIFLGPFTMVWRICKVQQKSYFHLLFEEMIYQKNSFPKSAFYLLYSVLSLGVILLISFSILRITVYPDSLELARIVNYITIALDWSIFSLLIREILFNEKHHEQVSFWVLCLIAGGLFLEVQKNIHGYENLFDIPAAWATLNSILCSIAAIIAILISRIKQQKATS
jgi:hypothetical protein